MHVYRTTHETNYTVLPNEMLQRRDLSFLALGILAYLISLPKDNDVTVAKIEAMRKEGKAAVRGAIAELRALGYYIKEDRQDDRGRVRGWSAVTDTPNVFSQVAPTAEIQPGGLSPVGEPDGGLSAENPVKETSVKETFPSPNPSATAAKAPEGAEEAPKGEGARQSVSREDVRAAESILGAVAARDRRLTVPRSAAARLAPVIAEWLARGASERQVIDAAVSGPNEGIRSAERIIKHRLDKLMPVATVTRITSVKPLQDCPVCELPWRGEGVCDGCKRGQKRQIPAPADDPAIRGAARARAMLLDKIAS